MINPLSIVNTLSNYITLGYRNVTKRGTLKIRGRIIIRGRGSLIFGNEVKINAGFGYNPVGLSGKCAFYIAPNAKISIGDRVGISNSLFYARDEIIVDDDVLVGGGCQLLDNDFHSLDAHQRVSTEKENIGKKLIWIKRNAFIGANSIILKGVIIGECSIIGAGSVVTKSVPANQIWGGNPAKFIKDISIIS